MNETVRIRELEAEVAYLKAWLLEVLKPITSDEFDGLIARETDGLKNVERPVTVWCPLLPQEDEQ